MDSGNDGFLVPPPHNLEAEQGLLSVLLVEPKFIGEVADIVAPEHFFAPAHGNIFQALLTSDYRHGATWQTLLSHLNEEEFADVGGARQYVIDLMAALIGTFNTRAYAENIRDLWLRRQLIVSLTDTLHDARSIAADRPARIVIEGLEDRLYSLSTGSGDADGAKPIAAGVDEALEAIDRATKGDLPGVKTGLADLDKMIKALRPGRLYVLGGRTAMGKSALALSIADNAARAGAKGLYFSLEMTRAELGHRLIARRTGISTDEQEDGFKDQQQTHRLTEAAKAVRALPLTVDDRSALTLSQIRNTVRRRKRAGGLDFVIVDHLALIGGGDRKQPATYRIAENTIGLKNIAKDFDVPVVLLAQINRGVEDRDDKRPGLSDLKDSGSIEQDADVVMFVFREEYYLNKESGPVQAKGEKGTDYAERLTAWQDRQRAARGKAEIIIGKQRGGRVGFVRVNFDGRRQSFDDLPEGDK